MRISEKFPSNYVSEVDLKGQARTMVMTVVTMEEVGMKKDMKPVVYFQGAKKRLILNKTNASVISSLYGDDTTGWVGKFIELFPTTTDFQGEVKPCVRVRQPSVQENLGIVNPPPETLRPDPQQPETHPEFDTPPVDAEDEISF